MKTKHLFSPKALIPKFMLILTAGLGSVSVNANCSDAITPTAALNNFRVLDSANEVQDLRSGLIWKRCVVGRSFDKSTASCSGTSGRYDWQGALQQAEQAANNSGLAWRLPSIKELNSIVEHACTPKTNSLFSFPSPVWSGTPYTGFGSQNRSYLVDFRFGVLFGSRSINNMYEVILVREAPQPSSQI
ncbi:DUF1566 domain-containing protein [Bacterioplanoides sp. SCSIO 12839]|uniref:Lcl C-terminal domain-containing protein n=1 Tax=Bacterioplanoides sp. SCSIO 12839 TaxID=2829569 RepID=UPI002104E2A8|nr:DUF1566 domain-containing protein [Bacterioplanoides sp. SCSIO 12839]UTW47634.1 DUF1566 domain-containing protein [Bacterioplanoides sp. SCSIO 12839]